MSNTYTYTETFTTTRIKVLDDHFEMFLTCSNMKEERIKKLMAAVERHELCAVGIYIADNGYRIAEVEFEVDWEEHKKQLTLHGEIFNANLPGFKNNVAPEAYVAAQRLVKAANEMNKPVRSWIRVSPNVRSSDEKHKEVCKKLGYNFEGSIEPWKGTPVSRERSINYIPEAKVIQRTTAE